VIVPANTTATVILPKPLPKDKAGNVEATNAPQEIGSGSYHFETSF